MNKTEFLKRLEAGLAGASPEERVAALQYFTEYLDEAGPEREAEVLAELGSPEQVAADVLSVAGGEGPEGAAGATGEDSRPTAALVPATQAGPQAPAKTVPDWLVSVADVLSGLGESAKVQRPLSGPGVYPPPPPAPPPPGTAGRAGEGSADTEAGGTPGPGAGEGGTGTGGAPPPATRALSTDVTPRRETTRGGYDARNTQIAVIILLALAAVFILSFVFSSGIWNVAWVLIRIVLWAVVGAVSILLIPAFAGLALAASGVFVIVMGALLTPASVGSGLVAMGLGIFILGLGLMCLYGGIRLLTKVVPAAVRGIAHLVRKAMETAAKKKGGRREDTNHG